MDFMLVKSGGLTGLAILLALTVYKLLEVFVFSKLKKNDINGNQLKNIILTTLTNDLEFGRVVKILENIENSLIKLNNTTSAIKNDISDIRNIVERTEKKVDDLKNKIEAEFDYLEDKFSKRFDKLEELRK